MMNAEYTSQRLLCEFMDERHALGFSYKTGEKVIRRFLKDFPEPSDGKIEFCKDYVLAHTVRKPNQSTNTVLRDVCATNCFLDFVNRRGFSAYLVPRSSLPKVKRNFKAYIFSDSEIEQMIAAADSLPLTSQSPVRHLQLPVMLRILFNCGLRVSELLNLRICDVDMDENILAIYETKFHKNRLVPFSDTVADALKIYLSKSIFESDDSLLFPSPKLTGKYTLTGFHSLFRIHLRRAGIPYGGKGNGPRPHDIRHTFAVHCLNNWTLSGVDLTAALSVLSRYMGHSGISGTQKYLQLTAQMYPDITAKLEAAFGELIPSMEAVNETD